MAEGWGQLPWGETPWGEGGDTPTPYPNYEYQAVPKLFSGPQKPLGVGPDPNLTGYTGG